MDALALLGVFLKASLLSLGGLSSLPLLRADLVAPGIATDDQLVQAIAIGRISTGPNGLYVVSLGYLVGGAIGATVALLAASLPPLVIVPITAVARRWLFATPVAGLVRGVALATAGLLVATGLGIVTATGTPSWWQLALAAIATVLTYRGDAAPRDRDRDRGGSRISPRTLRSTSGVSVAGATEGPRAVGHRPEAGGSAAA